ncbi:Reverse transcriptase domain-containing protein [Aphis craccivora]|uniref:Reverse transcriptase domain-containing protein n=1 Tax=Aphis craccivora TaxID=307492 RepID=A0A6G0ZHL3_APHCR|nr:Reverse transcriptase domain-containing protein [Aphis craccivora]
MYLNCEIAVSPTLLSGNVSPILFALFINGVKCILNTANSCIIDDTKLIYYIMAFNNFNDCLKLKYDLNSFMKWFNTINLSIRLALIYKYICF